MLPVRRISGDSFMLGYVYNYFTPSTINHQTYRWIRKPFWLPMAKSKIFKIPVRKKIPEDELKEFMKLYNHYRTFNKSLRNYCKEQIEKSAIKLDEAYLAEIEEQDFISCTKINDEWNKKIADERKLRREIEKNDRIKKILEDIEKRDNTLKLSQILMDKKIKQAKIDRKSFITEENIDQAIEEAFNSITSFDKALNLKGQFIEDLSSPTQDTKMQEKAQ